MLVHEPQNRPPSTIMSEGTGSRAGSCCPQPAQPRHVVVPRMRHDAGALEHRLRGRVTVGEDLEEEWRWRPGARPSALALRELVPSRAEVRSHLSCWEVWPEVPFAALCRALSEFTETRRPLRTPMFGPQRVRDARRLSSDGRKRPTDCVSQPPGPPGYAVSECSPRATARKTLAASRC